MGSSLNLSITARRALNPTSLIFERSVNTAGSAPASKSPQILDVRNPVFFMRNLFNAAAAGDPADPKTIIAAFSHATPCSEP